MLFGTYLHDTVVWTVFSCMMAFIEDDERNLGNTHHSNHVQMSHQGDEEIAYCLRRRLSRICGVMTKTSARKM